MTVTTMPQAEADTGKKGKKGKKGKDAEGGGGGKKKLIIIVALVAILGGAGYWFFLKPSGPPPKPVEGTVVPLDATQINLEGGHYLRIAIALQLTDKATEADGSKALDATIKLFSGRSITEVNDPKERRSCTTSSPRS
ncbi:MAG: flagellar basal body-associated FliL family protein [Nocardioidaceae bacterium]